MWMPLLSLQMAWPLLFAGQEPHLPERPPPGKAGPFTSADGEHFRVVCQFDSPAIAALALEAAEAAWPLAASIYGPLAAPQELYRIHLLPDKEAYVRLEEALTGGRFARNLAFSSWTTKESYIAMQPARPVGASAHHLSTLTRRLIAHEATHLVLYHAHADFEWHPAWLSEGIAELVSDQAMRAKGWATTVERDPFTASRLHWVQHRMDYLDTSLVEMVLDDRGGYELPAVFFSFLDQRDGTRALHAFMESTRGLAGADASKSGNARALFLQSFAAKGLVALEDELRQALSRAEPQWREDSRSLERSTDGGAWTQIAFPKADALAWHVGRDLIGVRALEIVLELHAVETAPSASIFFGGAPLLEPGPAPPRAIDLAVGKGVRVRSVRNTSYSVPPGWMAEPATRLGSFVREGEPHRLRLTIDGEHWSLALDGETLLELDGQSFDPHFHLGLGAARGSLVHWRSIEYRGE